MQTDIISIKCKNLSKLKIFPVDIPTALNFYIILSISQHIIFFNEML